MGDDNFDWIQKSGPTSTDLTGPSVDHTLGTTEGRMQENDMVLFVAFFHISDYWDYLNIIESSKECDIIRAFIKKQENNNQFV